MATLKELKDLMANSNLTDQQIAELISTLTSMQKANEGNSQAVSLPLELLELLRKCTSNRGANLVCPKCGVWLSPRTESGKADSDISVRIAKRPLEIPMVLCSTIQGCQ